MDNSDAVIAVETAMVTIRRRQSRRALARSAGAAEDATQQVLDAVEAAPAPVGVTELAEALGVDQPRASKLVAGAVADGLLRREADQCDGRRSRLALTTDGWARVADVHAYRQQRFAAAMAGWTATERATFADLLTRFVTAMETP